MNFLANPINSVQSLSHVWLFATPWTVAHQTSLSFTISQSLLKSDPLSQWYYPTISLELFISQHSRWDSFAHSSMGSTNLSNTMALLVSYNCLNKNASLLNNEHKCSKKFFSDGQYLNFSSSALLSPVFILVSIQHVGQWSYWVKTGCS